MGSGGREGTLRGVGGGLKGDEDAIELSGGRKVFEGRGEAVAKKRRQSGPYVANLPHHDQMGSQGANKKSKQSNR